MNITRSLLLHVCCAPCLSGCIEPLTGLRDWRKVLPESPDFDITLFFYNPNIYPAEEWTRRMEETRRFAREWNDMKTIVQSGDESLWDEAVRGFEHEPERGERCFRCYRFRLEKSFEKARELGSDAVATTLTLSPQKNGAKVLSIGRQLSEITGIGFIEADFKKRDGFKRSLELCKQFGIYRQNYCGCRYSMHSESENK